MILRGLIICALAAFAGCFGAVKTKAPTLWTVSPTRGQVAREGAPRYDGVVRLGQVQVRAPYDSLKVAVLRPDGSLAFDPYNLYAAAPSALLRGPVKDVVEASGVFARVVHANSSAQAPYTLEVTVTRLALDCTQTGRREALVEVEALLLNGRTIVGQRLGRASVKTAVANYTKAFSEAVTGAVASAVKAL